MEFDRRYPITRLSQLEIGMRVVWELQGQAATAILSGQVVGRGQLPAMQGKLGIQLLDQPSIVIDPRAALMHQTIFFRQPEAATGPASRSETMAEVVARNVRALMRLRRWSQMDLSRRAHVSQTGISALVGEDPARQRPNPTLRTVVALANAFDTTPWQLCHPDLPPELIVDRNLARAVESL